jgi:glycosyltransferase involved in cell wall biosynthesis
MLCHVIPLKRVYEAVISLYELRRQGQLFTLQVAGGIDDPTAPRYALALLSLVERLGLTDVVTFCGHVEDPAPWYQSTDVFLSNSYWEGQQNALLEAMASGCYCLSHCWAGSDEVLPPEHIFITDSDLRAKLLSYTTTSETAQRRAQLHMRTIAEERFDARRMIREIVDIVESVDQ